VEENQKGMMREINEELRRRMLSDEGVQRMIRIRAYEIYVQRGCAPGREAEDWLQAESEILLYLISQFPTTEETVEAKKTSSRSAARSTATRSRKTETEAAEKKPARRAAKKSLDAEEKPRKPRQAKKKKEE
jgi:hypothetical protein